MNVFPNSLDNKRYYTLNCYNIRKYGEKVFKAPVDAGFTCPNIDGTKSSSGCIYCSGGSGYFTDDSSETIAAQLENQIRMIHSKHPGAKIIAYFQSYTNTYAPLETLRERYSEALKNPFTVGISIGTRADCISDETMEYLSELTKTTNLTVELGLQTVHDSTAQKINRCHTFEEFLQTFDKLKKRGIRTAVHIINGLPGENEEMMLETAEKVGRLAPDALKIHLLHVIKGTILADMYKSGSFATMSMEEYVDIVVKQLELIPQDTVIERITGDGDRNTLIAPLWSTRKIAVLSAIDKRQVQLKTFQGIRLSK